MQGSTKGPKSTFCDFGRTTFNHPGQGRPSGDPRLVRGVPVAESELHPEALEGAFLKRTSRLKMGAVWPQLFGCFQK